MPELMAARVEWHLPSGAVRDCLCFAQDDETLAWRRDRQELMSAMRRATQSRVVPAARIDPCMPPIVVDWALRALAFDYEPCHIIASNAAGFVATLGHPSI